MTKREITVPDWNWNPDVQDAAIHLKELQNLSSDLLA
jgi:hypothetical protein